MLPAELLKRVKQIEITTRRVVNDSLSGQFRSHFKGHGVQFSEHRVYVAGDDVRHIDWKVSARSREPLLKKFEEERELTVLLMVDGSQSQRFGSREKLKSEMSAELAGLIAAAASRAGDRVGLLIFGGEVETLLPPKRGRQHVFRVIAEVLGHRPRSEGTSIQKAALAADRLMKHSGVIFLISDFIDEGFEIAVSKLAIRHDVIVLWTRDRAEASLRSIGRIPIEGLEGGARTLIWGAGYRFANWLKEAQGARERSVDALKKRRIEIVEMEASENYVDALVRYFNLRSARVR